MELRRETQPGSALLRIQSPNNLVLLNEGNFWQAPDLLDDLLRELASIAGDMAVVDLLNTRDIVKEWVGGMCGLQEVHMALHEGRWDVVLEHDDV